MATACRDEEVSRSSSAQPTPGQQIPSETEPAAATPPPEVPTQVVASETTAADFPAPPTTATDDVSTREAAARKRKKTATLPSAAEPAPVPVVEVAETTAPPNPGAAPPATTKRGREMLDEDPYGSAGRAARPAKKMADENPF
jgi:hypothetical protein